MKLIQYKLSLDYENEAEKLLSMLDIEAIKEALDLFLDLLRLFPKKGTTNRPLPGRGLSGSQSTTADPGNTKNSVSQ